MSSISGPHPAIPSPEPGGDVPEAAPAPASEDAARAARADSDGLAARQAALGGGIAAGPAALDPTRPKSSVGIPTNGWTVAGHASYPPFDDKSPLAFAKYDRVFGGSAAEAAGHAFFEGYAAAESPLPRGGWLPAPGAGRPGFVQEANFELTAGVDVTGDRAISDGLYRLLRRSGAPQDARFALRDAQGRELEARKGDRLVPTFVEGGEVKEAEIRSQGGAWAAYRPGGAQPLAAPLVWRILGADGKVRGSAADKAETRSDLVGLAAGTRFDFLDGAGEPVAYDAKRDRIVPTWEEGGAWHALVPEKDAGGRVAGYEHQTLDAAGGKVLARAAIPADDAARLAKAHARDLMYRVQERSSGALRGDGRASDGFDASSFGRSHNVAAIDSSGLPEPAKDVRVAVDLAPGEELGVRWNGSQVAKPRRDADGKVTGFDGPAPAPGAALEPVVLGPGGAVKPARLVTVSAEEVQTLVAHLGPDAIETKAAAGVRFQGAPDEVRLTSGKVLDDARIVAATLESGARVAIGREENGAWRDLGRGILRGADLASARKNRGGARDVAWSESSMAAINAARADKIRSITVQRADGAEETIPASEVERVGHEQPYDVSPQDIWDAAARVRDGKSLTIESTRGAAAASHAVKRLSTERVDRAAVPRAALAADDQPGALAGGAAKEGRTYFRTSVDYLENGETKSKAYHYWAQMGPDGKIADYNFLVAPGDPGAPAAAAPDFFWQRHVKDPIEGRWEGESELPGASMRNIQALYNAATGALDAYSVGGALTVEDLETRRPIAPRPRR
jgi:hypothetical protein